MLRNKILYAVLILFTLLAIGCTRPDSAKQLLVSQGYTQVNTGGYAWFGCSDSDVFATKFTAVSPAGSPTSGVICEGLLKGKTIRF